MDTNVSCKKSKIVINPKMFSDTRVIFLGHLSILIPSFINTVSIDMPA